jgi:hypothetical protein
MGMVTIYSTTDPKIVALLEMALRDSAVKYHVANENAGEMMPNPAMTIDFQVREEDQQTATRVIERALREMGEGPERTAS